MKDKDKTKEQLLRIHWRNTAIFLAIIAVFFGLYLTHQYGYLLFHSLVEIFSVIIACAVFMFAWNSRRLSDNRYFIVIGIAYLFVGGADLLHMVSYPGMNVIRGGDTNLASQLWIVARYIESLSLLIAPVLIYRRIKAGSLFLGYLAVFVLLLMSIFHWGVFPVTFIEGAGLTAFKIGSEYIVIAILLAAIFLLWQRRSQFDRRIVILLTASMVITIASEISFTLYTDAYGISNAIGHLLKIISFCFIYKAVLVYGLEEPYKVIFKNLKDQEEELRAGKVFLDTTGRIAKIGGWEMDVATQDGKWTEEIFHFFELPVEDRPPPFNEQLKLFHPDDVPKLTQVMQLASEHGEPYDIELRVITAKGNQIWTQVICTPIIEDGKTVKLAGTFQDITERKQIEEEIRVYVAGVDNSNEGIVFTQMNGDIHYFNKSACRIFGYTPAEMKEINISKFSATLANGEKLESSLREK